MPAKQSNMLAALSSRWSDQEIAIIQKYYPRGGSRAVKKALVQAGLPARSTDAIHNKARSLGLHGPDPERRRIETRCATCANATAMLCSWLRNGDLKDVLQKQVFSASQDQKIVVIKACRKYVPGKLPPFGGA